ncbi:IS4 family transposase [Prosthecobacter sp.]|uniref:IS4 family transposase n=1 Tax=Prosthecobacter sp. TaxID=1965333 RepID=UPI003784FB25
MHPPSDAVVVQDSSVDLVSRILRLLQWSRDELETADQKRHQGPRRKIFDWQIIVGLIAHSLPFAGRFSQCLRHFFGMTLSDSALSQRRQQLGEDIFLLIMRETLRPLADVSVHAACFFQGLRLMGIDGTRWSVTNTAQHLARMTKMQTRSGSAAFAHIRMAALVELGTHAPLHATLGLDGESEMALSLPLLAALPQHSLLILDRLYGYASVLDVLQQQCDTARSQHYLVRVKDKLAAGVRAPLGDGSAMVEVRLCDKVKWRKVLKTMVVREVRGRVWSRTQGKWVEVRLWTSLGVEQAGAREVLELYARRWEQEVFYHELKLQVARSGLLQSHTPETAQQEIAALLMACALVAEERLAVAAEAGGEVQAAGAVRISLSICLEHTQALWLVLSSAQGLMDQAAQAELTRRVRAQIAAFALSPRRPRSCQRKVRQTVKDWPRMLSPTSVSAAPQYEVIKIA